MDRSTSRHHLVATSATRTLVLSIVGTRPGAITAYVAEGRVIEIDATRCRIDALVTTTPGREDQIREGLMKTWKIMFAGLESAAVQLTRNDN